MPRISMQATIGIKVRDDGRPALLRVPVVAAWRPSLADQARAWGTPTPAPWYIITTNEDGFWSGAADPPAVVDEWPEVLGPGEVAISAELVDPGEWAALERSIR